MAGGTLELKIQVLRGIFIGLVPLLMYVAILVLDPAIGPLGWAPFILLSCLLVASVVCLYRGQRESFGLALLLTCVSDVALGCVATLIYIGLQLHNSNI